MQPEAFLSKKFREFYSSKKLLGPPAIAQREFGIGAFGRKITERHIAFDSAADLNHFLRDESPLFVSYSAAYYSFPERKPMSAKGFLGSDLVYEFDADDLRTECKQEHDKWLCRKCGAHGKGLVDECSNCGESVEREEWVCPECLGAVKKQVFRLLDFLRDDFGFSEGISLNFSGSKGYHIHIRSKGIRNLSDRARIELLDYLTAQQLSMEALGFNLEGKRLYCPPMASAKGWGKKVLERIVLLFEKGDAEEIAAKSGISFRRAQQLLTDRSTILSELNQGLLFQIQGRDAKRFWISLVNSAVGALSLPVDRQTSSDLSKIVRVPETLHGGTGLAAKELSLKQLKEFNALNECVVFSKKMLKVELVRETPKFFLGGEWFGPLGIGEQGLPEFAAVYLAGRGALSAVEL
ncbi:MAG: DNA primase small subunit domain-containing protein [Candidatus Diapherotrites archaeon]